MTGSKGQTRCRTHVLCLPRLAEQPPAADALQRPLVPRSRFRARLRRSVRHYWSTMAQVFLAYAREDIAVAQSLKERIERRGVTVFLDVADLVRGKWREVI